MTAFAAAELPNGSSVREHRTDDQRNGGSVGSELAPWQLPAVLAIVAMGLRLPWAVW